MTKNWLCRTHVPCRIRGEGENLPVEEFTMLEIQPKPWSFDKWEPKPHGFWYQVGRDWEEWCASEQPDWLFPRLVIVEVDPARILRITSTREYMQFCDDYVVPHYGMMPNGEKVFLENHPDWKRVAKEYAGIEIAPYRAEFRREHMWYYGWDCASGCVWDLTAARVLKWVDRPTHPEEIRMDAFYTECLGYHNQPLTAEDAGVP